MMNADHLARQRSVSVVIAAKNAATTIETAIRSALREPEVGSVIVVDDGSTDQTADVARRADDGTSRIRVLSFSESSGPSFARNRGIEAGSEPFIAILDADDFFLHGRFAHLFDQPDWDMVADNIAFFSQPTDPTATHSVARFGPLAWNLDLESFVRGNIKRRNLERSELGFLKPLIRRSFLDCHDIQYDETLRLGEDYDLYTRALVLGGRFRVIHHCGYGAIVRNGSLSGRHSSEDLRRLTEVDTRLLQSLPLSPKQREALHAHETATRNRYRLRYYLDSRRRDGLLATLGKLTVDPAAWYPVIGGVLADKFRELYHRRKSLSVLEPRYLLPTIGPESGCVNGQGSSGAFLIY